jgi:hypothetical protein
MTNPPEGRDVLARRDAEVEPAGRVVALELRVGQSMSRLAAKLLDSAFFRASHHHGLPWVADIWLGTRSMTAAI